MRTRLQHAVAILAAILTVVLLFCLPAFAQSGSGPTPSPATNTLTRTISADGGTLFYYVELRGLDTNTCTAPFTDGGKNGPCRQPQAVINKLPRFIDHNVLVSIDAGIYDPVVIDGFYTKTSATLTLQGATAAAWNTYTPVSGTATGAVTSIAALAFPTHGIFTDSTQTWPATSSSNSYRLLRGRYVCMTSGAAINAARVIASASPTTLETIRNWNPVPAAADTYRLCTPSTIIRTTTNFVPALSIWNSVGNFTVNDMQIEQVGAAFSSSPPISTRNTTNRTGSNNLIIARVRTVSDAAVSANIGSESSIAFTDLALVTSDAAPSGQVSSNINNVASGMSLARLTLTGSYLHCQRNCLAATDASVNVNGVQIDSENVSPGNGPLVDMRSRGAFLSASNMWVSCISNLIGSGSSNQEGVIIGTGNVLTLNSLSVDGCATGINVGGLGPFEEANPTIANTSPAFVDVSKLGTPTLSISNTTIPSTGYGIRIGRGSSVDLAGATVTFTNVNDGGRDYIFFNDQNYTEAQVQALPGKLQVQGNACVYR